MPAASLFVPWLYLLLPMAAAALAVLRFRRTGDATPIRNLIVTTIAGAAGGLALVITYIRGFGVNLAMIQIVIACYWGVAVATALHAFSTALAWVFRRLTPGGSKGAPCCMGALIASSVVRAAILLAVIVPYVGAMVLIYRPRVVHPGTPTSILGVDYRDVAFTATDGMGLRGWWIPAAPAAPSDDVSGDETAEDETQDLPAAWGRRTVIFCHGFGSDKASQLRMVRDLVPNGYNVMAFDFRAHGESSGQLTTFGDIERRDVLGAVRWVRQNHPDESIQIFGLGEGLGAAALIGAAGDPSAEGQAIDAIAVFAPYDRLTTLLQDTADARFIGKAGWLATHLALPVAGAQFGTPLAQFSPALEADKIAPRPLLVIAAQKDRDIDITRSQQLYEQASQPKYAFWIQKGGRKKMLFKSDDAATAVRVFFTMARQMI